MSGAADPDWCAVPGCTSVITGRGLCRKHYIAARNRGELPPIVEPPGERTSALTARLGITSRQLDHWLSEGWTDVRGIDVGSGKYRRFTPDEAAGIEAIARAMAEVAKITARIRSGDVYRDGVHTHRARVAP